MNGKSGKRPHSRPNRSFDTVAQGRPRLGHSHSSGFPGFASFTASFTTVRRWAREAYLVQEPEAPFIALTEGIAERFRDDPPYGGRHLRDRSSPR